MSEKTVIGGTVYETVGSSSSNLLLRCNGTARIQWGSKLIDLIKNGKIVSDNSGLNISNIQDKSEIKSNGIYILEEGDKYQLWLCKDDKQYNLTDSDLYISANTKQDITADQKKQALENIGFYFNTLEEVENSKIQNGLVYVIETQTLYTIQNGTISEFEAKLKTITVEKEQENGEVINNSVKLVLAISDDEYVTLQENSVIINKDLKISQEHCVCSEGASDYSGYRLYLQEGVSYLDIDVLNVRQTYVSKDYEEVTFRELMIKLNAFLLQPGMWYAITDYQNHWQFANLDAPYRPILVQAYTANSLYKEGKLLHDRSVLIHYDPTVQDDIQVTNSEGVVGSQTIKGKITWMRDENGNEADFDFLDYDLSFLEINTTVVHPYNQQSATKSIFPTGSYNNKITTVNLFGTIYDSEGVLQYPVDVNGNPKLTLNFTYNDSILDDGQQPQPMLFYNNVITCDGITISNTCTDFHDNTFKTVKDTTILANMTNSIFGNVDTCYFMVEVDNVTFKDLKYCSFEGGSLLNNVVCRSTVDFYPIPLQINSSDYPLLYNSNKYKNVYFTHPRQLMVEDVTESGGFFRGQIIMFYPGVGGAIPEGWAICDGSEVTWEGRKVTVPNLTGRFIKAVSDETLIGPYDVHEDNNFVLEEKHLPNHDHPHSHKVTVSGSYEDECTDYNANQMSIGQDKDAASVVTKTKTKNITLDGETTSLISESTTEEQEQESIKLEPNYYALIFIIKL